MPRRKAEQPHPDQMDMFPVRRPVERLRSLDLSSRIKAALSRALRECDLSVEEVAARMTVILGTDVSASALYAMTAPSKPDHQISMLRFIAFARATEAVWLWDAMVEDEGLVVLQGREARLAELGHLEQVSAKMRRRIADLKSELSTEPVKVRRSR